MAAALPPELAARYEVVADLGSGAMGSVLRVRERGTGQEVALKRMLPLVQERARSRFLREAALLARLDHPAILRRLDAGILADGTPYLVTELLPGTSLDAALPMADPLVVMRPVGEALQAAHAAGILHRDVKPANILHEPGGRTVLIDMGLALDPDLTRLTGTGQLVGSLAYMAPEVLRGEPATSASDWYAWGVTTYELAEGELPFRGETLLEVARGCPLPAPTFRRLAAGAPARRAIEAALVATPAQRPACWRDLEAVASGVAPRRDVTPSSGALLPLASDSVTLGSGTHPAPTRRRVPPLALVGLALLGVTLGKFLTRADPGDSPATPQPSPAPVSAADAREARWAELQGQATALEARLPVSARDGARDGPPAQRAAQLAPALVDPLLPLAWGRYLAALEAWLEVSSGGTAAGLDAASRDLVWLARFREVALWSPRGFLKAFTLVIKHPETTGASVGAVADRYREVQHRTLRWLEALPPALAASEVVRGLRWRWLIYFPEVDAVAEYRIVSDQLMPRIATNPLRREVFQSMGHLLGIMRVQLGVPCDERAAATSRYVAAVDASWGRLERWEKRWNRRRLDEILADLGCPIPSLDDGRDARAVVATWATLRRDE